MHSDSELFLSAQAGDVAAFEELIHRYEALVASVVIAGTKRSDEVEDIVQDTFVAAWTQRDSVREADKFRSWVCGIARNQARKAVARQARQAHLDLNEGPSAEAELLAKEEKALLVEALGELSENEQEALVLFYREGMSIRQVAQSLGISESAAQKRISRARHSVREDLCRRLEDKLPTTRSSMGVGAAVVLRISPPTAKGVASSVASAQVGTSAGMAWSGVQVGVGFLMGVGATAATLLFLSGEKEHEANATSAKYTEVIQDKNMELKSKEKGTEETENNQSTALHSAIKTKSPQKSRIRRVSKEERAKRIQQKVQSNVGSRAQGATVPALTKVEKKTEIKEAMSEVIPLIGECFAIALETGLNGDGRVLVNFNIGGREDEGLEGMVVDARIAERGGIFAEESEVNREFDECLIETIFSIEFEHIREQTAVSYPFVFRGPEANTE